MTVHVTESPEDGSFDFNDITQQPSNEEQQQQSRSGQPDDELPKPKRIACVLCRKRKLKCDSKRPACSTCVRLQHDCSYDEVRKKSGPKRGYVKQLEARLKQVETMLQSQDEDSSRVPILGRQDSEDAPKHPDIIVGGADYIDIPREKDLRYMLADEFANMNTNDPFTWEMIGLGLDEPLPTQDVIDDLNNEYFAKIHPSIPMMHKPRYYAAMNLAPYMRPPVALRYAMWALAAAVNDKYGGLAEHFYTRARKYLHQDEMRGHGECMITIAHAQAWILIATYEFKLMYFPRAWLSSGRASRMALMMGLHRVDGAGLDVKQCLPPPKDHIEKEERRRTFWGSFCVDRYSSIGTGWPVVIDERDIGSQLPCDDDSFEANITPDMIRLDEVLESPTVGVGKLSPFSGVVLMAALFGRNLTHLHRPGRDDREDDLHGEFWKRHRNLDDILSAISLGLPNALKLPSGLSNPIVVFLNMSIHTSTICLHQAAIFKADKNGMPSSISNESKRRCITAASEVSTIMRTISHLDLSAVNPFMPFCLYVASRVFVQYLKSQPKDTQVKASLQFLLQAMHAIKGKNPLTESFLVQLDIDLQGVGLDASSVMRDSLSRGESMENATKNNCPYANGGDGKPVAYGDLGVGVYNNPDVTGIPTISPIQPANNLTQPTTYNTQSLSDTFNTLKAQQRRSPSSYRSPSQQDMDTSTDGNTPSSSLLQNVSSHTSTSAYSPEQNVLQASNQFFDPVTTSFTTDLDMQAFADPQLHQSLQQQQQQQQQSLHQQQVPADWSSTGLTPGVSTGSDMLLNMSDAEFSQMMSNTEFAPWDTNATMISNTDALEALLASRR